MDRTWDGILARIAEGAAPADILRSLRPEGELETLKRCALVRTFDRDLFDNILTQGDVDFDEFVEVSDVEPVPLARETYRLQDSALRTYWDAWWDGDDERTLPADMRAVADRLAEHYRGTGQWLDLLAQLVLVAGHEAEDLLGERFKEADSRFDLAACQDLIDLLNDERRVPMLAPNLIVLRNRLAAHLKARSLWSAEYLQTGTFLETAGTRAVYENLLSGNGPRVLEMHAPGGHGKTMELRWLLSHVLVPAEIPCTKTDFDFIDPVNATRYPWLVLLEAAAQLNQQLPENPFKAFLETFGWATPLLRRQVSDARKAKAASRRMSTEAQIGDTVRKRFTQILATAATTAVVMVFDTLEEVHLRPRHHLRALLELLTYVHDRCPAVRIVLSGRYPPSGTLPPALHREPAGFSGQDAHRYLEQFRKIHSHAMRTAIVEKVGGNPFKLSLLADIVQQRPSLEPADVRRYEADLIYLVDKVIRRIEDPKVRWLLRYGVVPRTLSLEFVREVMQPELRHRWSGNVTHDHPKEDVLPEKLAGGEIFPTDLHSIDPQGGDLDRIWAQLRRYASTSSWVNPVRDDPESLRFHSSVTVPMRKVLRPKPVFRRLHNAAVTFFERKAEADGNRWDHWTCEAIYHRFQADGPAAAAYWCQVMDQVDLGDPERRATLAEEILGPDYVDREGRPYPVIDLKTVMLARFELASGLSQMARMREAHAADQLWSRAEEHFGVVDRAAGQFVPEWRMAYVRAALALKAGRLDDAEEYLRAALPSTRSTQDGVRLRILQADLQLRRGDRNAPATYRQALRAAQHLAVRNAGPHIRSLIIKAYHDLGLIQEAINELEIARTERPALDYEIRLRLVAVDLGLDTGRLEWAADHAGTVMKLTDDSRGRAALARVALARRQPKQALACGDTTALGHELTGLAAGALGEYGKASQALENARGLWQRDGDLIAVARCHTHSAMLYMRDVGNLTLAEHHLTEAAKPVIPVGSTWCRTALARAELAGLRGDHPYEVAELVTAVIQQLQEHHSRPQLLVQAAVEGLAIGLPTENRRFVELLVTQLHHVTPASARVQLLAGLDRVPDLRDEDSRSRLRDVKRLLRLPKGELAPADRALLNLPLAELDRLTHNLKAAEARLLDAHGGCQDLGTAFFIREWSRALDRLDGIGGHDRPQSTEATAFVREFKDFRTLCGAFLVERAEALFGVDDDQQAERLLRQAGPLLAKSAEHETQWHARLEKALGASNRRSETARKLKLIAAGAVFNLLGYAVHRWVAEATPGDSGKRMERSRASARLSVTGNQELKVRTWIPPLAQGEQTYRRNHSPLLGSLLSDTPELEDRLVDQLAQDWHKVGRDLGALMFPGTTMAAVASWRSELRCDIEDRRHNAVPWELMLDNGRLVTHTATMYRATNRADANRDEVSFVQSGLNRLRGLDLPTDGDLGEHTQEALGAYQEDRRLPVDGELSAALLSRLQRDLTPPAPARVVLAQPSGARQNLMVPKMYRKHGFDVTTVEEPTLERLAAAMRPAPAVLHLSCCGLRESGSGVALTFLGNEWETGGSRAADEIPVTSVAHLLARIPRESRPLVVIDVDRPWGTVDMIFYLLLRNSFTGDLFSLGKCAGVLGTGLAGKDGYDLYDTMIRSLATGGTLGETVTAMRGLSGDEPELAKALQFAGTTLHTHLPWLRVVTGHDDR